MRRSGGAAAETGDGFGLVAAISELVRVLAFAFLFALDELA